MQDWVQSSTNSVLGHQMLLPRTSVDLSCMLSSMLSAVEIRTRSGFSYCSTINSRACGVTIFFKYMCRDVDEINDSIRNDRRVKCMSDEKGGSRPLRRCLLTNRRNSAGV